jgi:alkyl sulfatase BDS1-like metallo-beta-lactamase superfamily hydrolase
MAKSREQLLDEMVDREAIRDLAVRYCDYIWKDDVDAVGALFTANGTFIKNPPPGITLAAQETHGRKAIVDMLAAGLKGMKPRPYIHNHAIQLHGNGRATGTVYVELRSPAVNWEWIGTGYYDDVYENIEGEWRFQSRKINLVSFKPPQTAN